MMVTWLGVGWAEHQLVPEGLSDEELERFEQRAAMPDASGHIEGEYGDCLLSFVSSSISIFDQNSMVDISMNCKFGYGGGGGGGGGGG